ncbi:MAG TPA: MerR family transcriptional regulator [Candidatus Limivivens intestinipullorum]|uniref:MerR family transcriptional regulator n=1 Tax=Candidatus Limivivens intestinipullorum TaxID=2840858 RepID=A0A9D1ER78_9FIRM|nr:MerR family transcriptional regulator [Candidatus Limivivens intestinipullorum]
MYYTIGEMARKLNVAPSTLRYYDKEGLLPFVERSDGGIRMFKDADFEWLSLIGCLKETGMPIKEIKYFMDLCTQGDSTIGARLALIERQRENVLEKITQMKETLHMLDYKKWYYETAREAGTCEVHQNRSKEDVPREFWDIMEREKNGNERDKN